MCVQVIKKYGRTVRTITWGEGKGQGDDDE